MIPWTAACQASLSFTISWSLLRFISIELIMLCHPLPPPVILPSVFPSIRVFSNESVLIRWPKYWSFNFIISPCNEYSGLISFGIDWFDLLAVQGTLKSLLQHHSSKASMIGRNYRAHKRARVFQADIINKNIPKCYVLGISVEQKEFCCGLIKLKEEFRGT